MIALNVVAQLGMMIELNFVTNNNNSTETILFNLVQTGIQGIHVLECIILIFSFGIFLGKLTQKKKIANYGNIFNRAMENHWLSLCVMFLPITVYIVFLLVSPSLYILTWKNSSSIIYYCYTVTLYVTHLSNGFIRVAMVSVTVIVRNTWKLNRSSLNATNEGQLRQRFDNLEKNYKEAGDFVSLLHTIFKAWFVLQWVTYFIATTVSFALLFDTVIENKLKVSIVLLDIIFYLIYYGLSLVVPYCCGIVMNAQHSRYRKQLEDTQKALFCLPNMDDSIFIVQNVQLIPVNLKYIFVPNLCGVSIPLNSTGHSLTIVLSLLAFILGLISKWANTI